ncbi:MAG TPA: SDR family NAD(P)-dependent oxidoreductase, partial [Nevskiaceae bacterium]|nr:SDR family NAD(P)-dependent oxidoreductase [Nevskiaceae bacterium]
TKGVVAELQSRGLTPVTVHETEPGALRAAVTAARAQHGPVRTFLHLHGLQPAPAEHLAAWRSLYHRDLLSLFHGLQSCLDDLNDARVVAASRLGGTFGRDAVGRGGPVAGGVNGILNCVRYEYPKCHARAVDFDGQSDAEVIRLLVTELLSVDAEKEAGYIGLERYGAVTVAEALAPSPFPSQVVTPTGEWVLLATGGARGITAEIIEELVRPGMRVVLLGRTAEPGPEDAATTPHADEASLKRAVLQAKLARGEKPKPVEIDREVSRVLVDREIRANLGKLRTAGAIVEYRACDVRDESALGGLLEELYARFGRIDAVIHGAGVIEDKLLADKSPDSFERVLSTKLDAAFVLSRRLKPETLKLLSFFTSVAGRYGNRGQSDYAAANEVLNRLAWELHRAWPQTRVVAVNWGPWDAGMANEGIKRTLRERGMEPIPVPAGRQFFVDELAHGPRNEVELVAGEGPWRDVSAPAAEPASTGFAFVRRAPLIGLGGAVTLEHRLTLNDDPYLGDHVLDGHPVLPMAAAMEYMAQFVACGWPEWKLAELRDLRVFAGVILDGEHGSDVVLRARAATHSEAGSQAVTVEIADPRRRSGPNYRATAVLLPQLPATSSPLIQRLPPSQQMEGRSAYGSVLPHGERFHSIRRIDAVHTSGVDAEVTASTPRSFLGDRGRGEWLLDPAVMDALPQMVFVWAQLNRRKGALPIRYGHVRRLGDGPLTGNLTVRARIKAFDADETLAVEAEILDAAGQVRVIVQEGESAMSTSLNRLAPSSPDFVAGMGSGRKS